MDQVDSKQTQNARNPITDKTVAKYITKEQKQTHYNPADKIMRINQEM